MSPRSRAADREENAERPLLGDGAPFSLYKRERLNWINAGRRRYLTTSARQPNPDVADFGASRSAGMQDRLAR
jgi:hypothetical protein